MPMKLIQRSPFSASVERLDPSKNYTIDNVVLIVLGLQSQQFNCLKKSDIEFIFKQNDTPLIDTDVFQKLSNNKRQKISHRQVCATCNTQLTPVNSFEKNSNCKNCIRVIFDEKVKTPRGFLQYLLTSSKQSAKKRKGEARTHTLTLEDLITKYQEQSGLCNISNVPLKLKRGDKYCASIDRIDNNKGYTKDNTQLILQFLNIRHRFTKEEFELVKSHYNKT
jgi:hypothetical protein